MTPAEKPRDPARTFRLASFTSDGMNTTEAPSPVAAPAAATRPIATPTFSFVDMMTRKGDSAVLQRVIRL